MTVPQIATIDRNPRHRKSSDSAWPLRGADGLTFAERQRCRERQTDTNTGDQ